jgi:predicted membrane metal-binding protein
MFYGTPTETAQPLDEAISNMGINHLFVISGFHIALLLTLIDKLLGMVFKRHEGIRFTIGTIIGLFFLYLIFGPWAAKRAWLYRVVTYICYRRFYELTNIDTLSITALIFLTLNP